MSLVNRPKLKVCQRVSKVEFRMDRSGARENSGRPRSKRVAAGSLALYKPRMKNPRKGRGPAEIGANAVMV